MHDKKGSVVDTAEYIDVITKAEELAFANESLGAIFVKDFRIEESSRKKPRPMKGNFDTENNQMIQKVGQEAWRTLKDNGLLVWLDLEKPALINLRNIGFDLVYYQERKFENSSRYQAVFKKDTSRK